MKIYLVRNGQTRHGELTEKGWFQLRKAKEIILEDIEIKNKDVYVPVYCYPPVHSGLHENAVKEIFRWPDCFTVAVRKELKPYSFKLPKLIKFADQDAIFIAHRADLEHALRERGDNFHSFPCGGSYVRIDTAALRTT